MNSLFQTICRIGIFMICAQAIVHFRPEETYEKYLKLLVSAMVLIQLFLPIGRLLLLHGDREELAMRSEAFLKSLEEEISDAEREAYETDALLEQMTLEEVMRRMEEAQAAVDGGVSENEMLQNSVPGSGEMGRLEEGNASNSVNIDKIEVEEIQVQLQTDG